MTLDLIQRNTGSGKISEDVGGDSASHESPASHSDDDENSETASEIPNKGSPIVQIAKADENLPADGKTPDVDTTTGLKSENKGDNVTLLDAVKSEDRARMDAATGADLHHDGDAKPCDKDGYRNPCLADPKNPPLLPVKEIVVEKPDVYGNTIIQIFNKRPCYAIYVARDKKSKESVHVHLSDNQDRADEQIDRLIELNCLRAKLEYLTAGLKARNYYNKQTAVALQAALERDSCDQAKEHLQLLVKNATEERACLGRQFYMISAGAVAAVLALILMGIGGNLTGGATQTGMLLLSSGAGALGAVLSIFIALRNRTVAPDQDWQTNIIDGAARIGIGVISAFALHLLLTSDFLSNSIASGLSLTGNGAVGTVSAIAWKSALLIGFAGGFLERLVPDLLEKSHPPTAPSEKAKTTDPL
jgi:hypothetical protein